MKKIILLVFTIVISWLTVAFNQQYYDSLPEWDKYNIKLINSILPSVVNIVWYEKTYKPVYEYIDLGWWFYVKVPKWYIFKWYQPVSMWTAFFLTSNWVLITNAHVVKDKNLKYKAVTYDWKKYDIKILAISDKYDLALIYIKWKNFKPVKLINSDNVMIWQTVFAIWNSLWKYPYTVSNGIVSWKWRSIIAWWVYSKEMLTNLIQTTAPLSPWNSWGPLIDSLWNVIWINTAINLEWQNLWFAIPTNTIISWIYSLSKK